MTWLLAYAIGALAWTSITLAITEQFDEAARRRMAIHSLWIAILWPLEVLRFAGCLVAAVRELIAERRRNGGSK